MHIQAVRGGEVDDRFCDAGAAKRRSSCSAPRRAVRWRVVVRRAVRTAHRVVCGQRNANVGRRELLQQSWRSLLCSSSYSTGRCHTLLRPTL